MSDTAIAIKGLSKRYTIGESQPYHTLRETITSAVRLPFRAAQRLGQATANKREQPSVWALRDVSFEIKQGDVIGIVGRNGAGKSTLLKILSRITEPTLGTAELHGRIGTLLEVGTGFHPELTGRENIYLNGAILGMNRREITARFDEIVGFAEVEKFVDTPVKFYSSGMYLRLAFAVAAHLETEILMVDEVLAVGDLAFQNKCLGKMGEAAKCGRTVLFVSHNMGAIRALCEKGLVLHKGEIAFCGDISESIEKYFRLAGGTDPESSQQEASASEFGFGRVRLLGEESSTVAQGSSIELATVLHMPREVAGFSLYCILNDMHQRKILQKQLDSTELRRGTAWQGSYDLRISLPPLWLEPGLYSVYFKVFFRIAGQSARHLSDIFHLDVAGASTGCGSILSPEANWSLIKADESYSEIAQTAEA